MVILPSPRTPDRVVLAGFSARGFFAAGCSSRSRAVRRVMTLPGALLAAASSPEAVAEVGAPAGGPVIHLERAPHRVLEEGPFFDGGD